MSFSSKNLSYIFNKEYFGAVTTDSGAARSEEAIASVNRAFVSSGVSLEHQILGTHSFLLQVRYPGLLVGLGYAHQSTAISGDVRGDIALGFSFDYVTGVPYIPGSTVKGVLRNAFAQANDDYVQAFFGDDSIDIAQLEQEIFDTGEEDDNPNQDVFFDAFPSPETPRKSNDTLFYLLDLDVNTPHGEGLTATPNPLTFVKVKPGVVFDFRFDLHDGLISAGKKRALFKQILKDFGIGAKTNVGFGVLDEIDPNLHIDSNMRQPHANSAEPTVKVCPNCGTPNHKFKKNSNEVNPNWSRNECFRCRRKLS